MRPSMSTRHITIAVVTYNSESVIGDFLLALEAATSDIADVVDTDVVVVDNCSRDSTAAVVANTAPDATFIRMPTNAGYAAAINAAVAAISSDAVLIANPDTRPEREAIARLARALDDPRVGVAAPRLLDESGSLQLSLRRDATLGRGFGEALLGGKRASRYQALSQVVGDTMEYERVHDVDWASGALLLVSRECFAATGPWDESFFLYGEEEEFQQRARRHGLVVRYVPDAIAVHVGGEMHVEPRLWALGTVNKLRLYARSHGRFTTAAFRFALVCNEALRAPRGEAHRRALGVLCSSDALSGPIPK